MSVSISPLSTISCLSPFTEGAKRRGVAEHVMDAPVNRFLRVSKAHCLTERVLERLNFRSLGMFLFGVAILRGGSSWRSRHVPN